MKYQIKGNTKHGMSYPSTEFLKDVKLWDSMFEDYHKSAPDGLLRTLGVVQGLVDLIKKQFGDKYDEKIIKKFALSRTCFRMRAIGKVIHPKYHSPYIE